MKAHRTADMITFASASKATLELSEKRFELKLLNKCFFMPWVKGYAMCTQLQLTDVAIAVCVARQDKVQSNLNASLSRTHTQRQVSVCCLQPTWVCESGVDSGAQCRFHLYPNTKGYGSKSLLDIVTNGFDS